MSNNNHAPLFHPLSRRLHLLLLCMFGLFCSMNMNVNFAISITCMVNSTAIAIKNEAEKQVDDIIDDYIFGKIDNSTEGTCGEFSNTDGKFNKVPDYGGTLLWDLQVQNILFSASFWGGVIAIPPSILFVHRISPKLCFLVVIAVKALVNVCTPYLALNYHYYAVFCARFILGFGEMFIYPGINTVVTAWYPVEERSTAIAIFTTGNQLALFLGSPISALFCKSQWGWPAIFYFAGAISLLWCILWMLFASDTPDECRKMMKSERLLLNKITLSRKPSAAMRKEPVPWNKVLSNKAFLAHLYATCNLTVIATVLMVYTPSYFKQVLFLGVIANGTFTSIPMFFNFAFKLTWGIIVDKLKKRRILTPTQSVKISQCFPTFGCAFFLLLVIFFVDCSSPILALILFSLCNLCVGCHTSGAYTSLLSLAPQYTPSLSSVSIATSMIGQLVTPFLVATLNTEGTRKEWNHVFAAVALLCASSGIVFTIFGSGEIQRFARTEAEISLGKQKLKETDDNGLLQVRMQNLRADSLSML